MRRAPIRRPRRGPADETRGRLVTAAAAEFNREGYHGTDSNRLAKAAGYSPGTFYKHFRDKREIFLAVWDDWVTREWEAVDREVGSARTPEALASRLVDLTLALHVRWRGLRASMHALAATDAVFRRFHRAQRRGQLDQLAALRARHGLAPRAPEADAVLLFTLERSCDAIALGETRDLRLQRAGIVAALVSRVHAHLAPDSDA